MLTPTQMVLAAVAVLIGCQPAADQRADSPALTRVPVVPALDFADVPTEAVFQALADSSDIEVTFSACDDWLSKKVTIHTGAPKTVPVLVAMVMTNTNATATLDGNHWTLFCREAAGPGRLFRKNRAPENVTVPKEPESPK